MASENVTTTPSTASNTTLDGGTPDSVPSSPGLPLKPPSEGVADPAGPFLVGCLLVLGVLTALVPIRNSDFFQHLALGRAVVQGNLPLGSDPLTAPGETVPWAHHSWMFDVLLYLLYGMGGAILILLVKALLVVLLLSQQWSVARVSGTQASPGVLCLLLGLVVLSPYLLVQSRLASLVLLAVTLTVLAGYHIGAQKFPPIWTLPLICLLWGNLDSWFFLGPLTIGLYFAGLMIEQSMQSAPPEGTPAARIDAPLWPIFGASLLASCLNPGIFALGWSLPPELGLNSCLAAVGDLPGYRQLSATPLSGDYYLPTTGWSVAGQGYLVLLLLTLLSFPLLGRRLSWAGLLPVLVLGMLSLYRVAAIPFFAVLAAPLLARNIQQLLKVQAERTPLKQNDATSGVLLTGLLFLLVGVSTYAGWLNAWPWTQSRFGLGLETNAGLKEMADRVQTLATWYREKTSENAPTWFNTSPEAAHYIAWFAPGQRTYLDQRLALSQAAAADYRNVLASFFERLQSQKDTFEVLRQRGIRFVAFHQGGLMNAIQGVNKLGPDTPLEVLVREIPPCLPLFQLGQSTAEWPLLGIRGATGLFGFADPREPKWKELFAAEKVDLDRLAFGTRPLMAPGQRPEQEAEPRNWLTTLWNPEPLRNVEAEETAQFWLLYESSIIPLARQSLNEWEAIRVSAILGFSADLPSLASAPFAALQMRLFNPQSPLANRFLEDVDRGNPAALYTVLRTGRQSLAGNPLDAQMQLRLAQSFFAISHSSRESKRSTSFPHLNQLRRYQIIAAAQAAVRLNPELEAAHQLLAVTYEELGALDLFLEHYREAIRLSVAAGPRPGESAEDADKRWKVENERLLAVEKEIKSRTSRWTVQTARRKALEKAAAAIWPGPEGQSPGLIREGLAILREMSPEELTEAIQGQQPIGPRLFIEALFLVGDLPQIRATLDGADSRLFGMHPVLGMPAIEWYRFCLDASAGDYDKANETLNGLLQAVTRDRAVDKSSELAVRALTESLASLAGIGRAHVAPLALMFQGPQERFFFAIEMALASRENPSIKSTLQTLQGCLFLEWGENEKAREVLANALEEARRTDIGFQGQQVAELNLELLQSVGPAGNMP